MPVSPLKKGTQLCPYLDHEGKRQFRFKLIKNAGSGTFGNTYSADDVIFGDVCIIKEFAFAELCNRDTKTGSIVPYECEDARIFQQRLELQIRWLDRFELEARNLITIYHTNVISVRLVWRERGTAFYAMNKVEGEELLSPDQEDWQAKSWPEVESIAFKLLGALEAVHDVELIHGDVKPGNVLLTSKNEPILIDFGTARNLAEFQATLSANTHAYTPGYAPPELHGVDQTKNVGPWSDLYSWAILIIGLLVKHPKTTYGGPISIVSRFSLKKDPYSDLASWLPKDVPSNVLEVLQKCVQLDYTKRPKNVEETRNLFASKPVVFTQTDPSLENKALQKALRENVELVSQLREELQQSEQIYQQESMETRKIKMAKNNLQRTKTELQSRLKTSQETLEKEQKKANQAIEALQKEKSRAEQERTRIKQLEKALQKEKTQAEQEKNRTKQTEQALKKSKEALRKERIKVNQTEKTLQEERSRAAQAKEALRKEKNKTKQEKSRIKQLEKERTEVTQIKEALQEEKTKTVEAERELLIFFRTLQKERSRAEQEQTRADKAEQALQEERNKTKQERTRTKKAEQALQQDRTRTERAEKALQKEKTRMKQAEQALQKEKLKQEQFIKKLVDTIHVRKPKPEGFVLIPAGSFMMGSPKTEEGHYSDEFLHRVVLTRSFYMQQTQVTQAQWKALMGNNPSYFKSYFKRDSLPVECVSWFEACAYANALSLKEGLPEAYRLINPKGKPGTKAFSCSRVQVIGGDPYLCKGYRLPMEAEWEYAVRAGMKTRFYNGNDASKLYQITWYSSNSNKKTHPVGKKNVNPWGLYDMSGNVWEWCWDWFGSDYYESSPATDPTGPDTGSARVLRGGSWLNSALSARSARRSLSYPEPRSRGIGFRLVSSAP